MIVGMRYATPAADIDREHLERAAGLSGMRTAPDRAVSAAAPGAAGDQRGGASAVQSRVQRESQVHVEGGLGLAGRRSHPAPPGEPRSFDFAATDGAVALFTGRLFNQAELADSLADRIDVDSPAELLLALHQRDGDTFASQLNGPFAFAIFEPASNRLILGRDHLGLEPLYYRHEGSGLYFASSISGVLAAAGRSWELNYQALVRCLFFNYNPAASTLAAGVEALRPGHVLSHQPDHHIELRRYWQLSFSPAYDMDAAALCEELRHRFREAVRCRLPQQSSTGVFLSGGLDSSTVAALAGEQSGEPLHTYAFRCDDASCDESHFARHMAEAAGAEHACVDYTPAALTVMAEATAHMSEPFDEAGINVASYLLGQQALRHDAVVLTGDGGDELFAGHPVYQADAMARHADRLPRWLRGPGLALLRQLPDPRQQQNLVVKLKRFAEGMTLPPGLLSNRWRAHYQPTDLAGVLHPDIAAQIDWDRVFEPVIALGDDADDRDLLSRSLSVDYQSILSFYLRRNDMLRGLGIEARCPLLDHRLVEFCARIPNRHKVPRWSDTKAIMRKAVEPMLPEAIAHRQDKLGHSVPLKNWLREDEQAQRFVFDQLGDAGLGARGLVRREGVQRLIDDHLSKRRNNSHRLWTLTVLELWMQHHLDGSATP
jgi:asparagine synthase (glutamine-hydrolysing)